jgi:hypothetical protein
MNLSRREFVKLFGSLVGGWAITLPGGSDLGKIVKDWNILSTHSDSNAADDSTDAYYRNPSPRLNSEKEFLYREREPATYPKDLRELEKIGRFSEVSPRYYVFDENKYSSAKRKLPPAEWKTTNRHMPIKIEPSVINKPGERSPEAIKRVVEYTQFNNPRYVAARGERVTMCNIAAWDWSRALQLHLPHWIGETELSANMLFRWISHPQAGGVYGEGWQPVNARAAQLLANRGIPVFALAENSNPRRHGHVCMVYPSLTNNPSIEPYFATVANGRTRGGNGIKTLRNTFRWLTPTYFVHKLDFIVHQNF